MTDTPDLWWSPTVGLIQKMDGYYRAYGGGSQRWLGTLLADQFPTDVVQLVSAAERDKLQARIATQAQTLEIVRAQNDECVEQVDAALGHRYHTPDHHYSIPHVAEKAAAELQQLQARIDALGKQVAAGHRAQLPTAGQWLGHAADRLDGPAADYLDRLGEWLTGNAEGDEPEPRAVLQGDQPAEPEETR